MSRREIRLNVSGKRCVSLHDVGRDISTAVVRRWYKHGILVAPGLYNIQYNMCLYTCYRLMRERDVAQSIACPPLKRSVVGSILLSGPSCSLGYFPFQPVVHNWFIKGRGMYCSVYEKVHIKDPLLLIEKSSLCGGSGFPSKKVCQRDHMNDVQ